MKLLILNLCIRESCKPIVPVGLGYIMTALQRAGYRFDFIDIDLNRISDDQLRQRLEQNQYDVVALGCIVTGYKYVKKISRMIKDVKPETVVIAGNTVASSIDDILLGKTDVDIAVMGEGDITIVELLAAIDRGQPLTGITGISFKQGGEIVKNKPRPVVMDIDAIPPVNWELFDIEKYLEISRYNTAKPYPVPFEQIRMMPINVARGCAFNCGFCYHAFKGLKYRVRTPENVIADIRKVKDQYGVNVVSFWDELTFYSRKQCEYFVDRMLEADLGIFYTACCRANLFTEQEYDLCVKLKKSGCYGLEFSLESASPEILKAMKKGTSPENFQKQVRVLQRAGIICWTSLVIGYPQETEETIKLTYDCCYDCDIYPSTGFLLPQPGTEVYDWALAHGHIPDVEDFLLKLGDRQDLRFNLTGLRSERLQELVKQHSQRISDKLNLGLRADKLIKTDGAFVGIKQPPPAARHGRAKND